MERAGTKVSLFCFAFLTILLVIVLKLPNFVLPLIQQTNFTYIQYSTYNFNDVHVGSDMTGTVCV
jgi:hypothetical protein